MKNELIGVVIDPSHGGIDFGINNSEFKEKDIVLELSKYIKDRLEQLGIDTIITRNNDSTISPTERINKISNTLGDREGVVVISNGLNNINNKETDIIYSVNETNLDLVNNIKKQLEYEGFEPIYIYKNTLPSNDNIDANILQRELNNAKVIVIEYGNILNQNKIDEVNNLIYNYGEGIVRGIASNYGIAYEEPNNIKLNTHIVSKGESLYSIAKDYDTTIGAIKSLNNLKTNILSIGQILKLPNYVNLSKTGKDIVIYTIKKGDTLYNIAKKYNVDIQDILEYNQLFNTILTIGQQLLIPIDEKKENNNITYIVQKGDSLYSIAKKYNVNINDLININKLNSNMISIGQSIDIPNTSNYQTYYVRTNDTLDSIAKKFNTTISDIKRINNLNTDDITIGQLLIIN